MSYLPDYVPPGSRVTVDLRGYVTEKEFKSEMDKVKVGKNVKLDDYVTKTDFENKIKNISDLSKYVNKTTFDTSIKNINDNISKLKTGSGVDLSPYLLKTTYISDKDTFAKATDLSSHISSFDTLQKLVNTDHNKSNVHETLIDTNIKNIKKNKDDLSHVSNEVDGNETNILKFDTDITLLKSKVDDLPKKYAEKKEVDDLDLRVKNVKTTADKINKDYLDTNTFLKKLSEHTTKITKEIKDDINKSHSTKSDNKEIKKLLAKYKQDNDLILGRTYFMPGDGYSNQHIYAPVANNLRTDVDGGSLYVTTWSSIGQNKGSLVKYKNIKGPNFNANMPFELRFDNTMLNYGNTSNFNLNITNIYIVYKYDRFEYYQVGQYTLSGALFGAMAVTSRDVTDFDTYEYRGRGLCIDRTGGYTFNEPDGGTSWAQNIVIFGSDNSSAPNVTNRNHTYTIVGKNASEFNEYVCYPTNDMKINQSNHDKKFVVSLHYNGVNSYLFCNGVQQVKFSAINYPIKDDFGFSLGNITTDINSGKNFEHLSKNGHIYEFGVDNRAMGVEEIKQIHTYLMKKHIVV